MPTLLAPLEIVPHQPLVTMDVDLHRRLAYHLRARLAPRLDAEVDWLHDSREAEDVADLRHFLHTEDVEATRRCAAVPADADGFVAWFENLKSSGPGQGDVLFPWLEFEADEEAMRWFLRQELAGEAGFDDLVALALVRLPARPKMEMARNLWDEFGRGNPDGVHGTLLTRMANELHLSCSIEDATGEALALSNLMVGLAVERHAYQSIGALGVIELTAPGRVACVARGMRRLGMPATSRRYYDLHATLDIEHSRRWNAEVLHPLVERTPATSQLLARGALMRLEAGRRCFARYRRVLGLN